MSSPEVFRQSRVVGADDVDVLGHVNNVVWLRYVVELAEAHARARRVASRLVREGGGLWLVRRHELDYHGNANEGDEIAGETWVESMRGARSIRGTRFALARDGRRLLVARTHWAYVDARTLRPKRIPEPLLAAYRSRPGV